MRKDIIYDIGAHRGEDTAFYLSRGYDVIAVEADPTLVASLRERFREEIEEGRLLLIDKAISPTAGDVTFYANSYSEWGTINSDFADRNLRLGCPSVPQKVKGITFRSLLGSHPKPFYIKIDVEGMDISCLRELSGTDKVPTYISVESSVTSPTGRWEDEMKLLVSMGFRRFKFVDQSELQFLNGSVLDKNGETVRYEREGHSSGPFGDEAPGEWQDENAARRMARKIRRDYLLFSRSSPLSRLIRKVTRLYRKQDTRWYDLHAAKPAQVKSN